MIESNVPHKPDFLGDPAPATRHSEASPARNPTALIADDALMQSDSIRSGRQGWSGADSGEGKLKLQCLPRVWLASGLGQREKWLRFVWEHPRHESRL